jgi:hypothetical protein
MIFDHQPGETCPHCGLEVNEYGNTEADPCQFCQFPDCGCDGARLCQAVEGPNENSGKCNVEGMYSRTDKAAVKARMETYGLCITKPTRKEGA